MGLIQKQTYVSSSELSSHSITFGSTAGTGNTLIALVTSTALITTPSGWTKISSNTAGLDVAAYRITATAETGVTFALSAPRGLIAVVYEFDDIGVTLTTGTHESTSLSDIQFPIMTATQNIRVFTFLGLGPADINAGTSWTGGVLNFNRNALHATTITNTQSQLSSYTEMTNGQSLRPVTRPGTTVTDVQGIYFIVAAQLDYFVRVGGVWGVPGKFVKQSGSWT